MDFEAIQATNKFSGSMNDIRMWNTVLDETEINHHVYDFTSIATKDFYNVRDNLIAQWKFDEKGNISIENEANYPLDYSFNSPYINKPTASGYTGTASLDFTNITLDARTHLATYLPWNKSSDKIRIGYSASVQNDSPELGIYWSPSDVINEDIVHEFGLTDFNDMIGDPSDMFSGSYQDLDAIKKWYGLKYQDNYNIAAFVRYIRLFDKALISIIQNVIPARVRLSTGLLIEPVIFDRSKHKWEPLSVEVSNMTASIAVLFDELKFSGSNTSYQIGTITPETEIPLSVTLYDFSTGSISWEVDGKIDGVFGFDTPGEIIISGTYSGAIETTHFDDYIQYAFTSASQGKMYYNYDIAHEQLKTVTYVGTQNTVATDYFGAPWEVSESAVGFLRVK